MWEKRTNKYEFGLALSVRRDKFLALFWGFCAPVAIASVYPSEIPTQLPGTLTHPLVLADPASWSTGPYSSFNSCLSMTVAFPWLSLTPVCSLLWDLAFPRLLPVSLEISDTISLCGFQTKTDKGILWVALTHTHTTNTHYHATIKLGKENNCLLMT